MTGGDDSDSASHSSVMPPWDTVPSPALPPAVIGGGPHTYHTYTLPHYLFHSAHHHTSGVGVIGGLSHSIPSVDLHMALTSLPSLPAAHWVPPCCNSLLPEWARWFCRPTVTLLFSAIPPAFTCLVVVGDIFTYWSTCLPGWWWLVGLHFAWSHSCHCLIALPSPASPYIVDLHRSPLTPSYRFTLCASGPPLSLPPHRLSSSLLHVQAILLHTSHWALTTMGPVHLSLPFCPTVPALSVLLGGVPVLKEAIHLFYWLMPSDLLTLWWPVTTDPSIRWPVMMKWYRLTSDWYRAEIPVELTVTLPTGDDDSIWPLDGGSRLHLWALYCLWHETQWRPTVLIDGGDQVPVTLNWHWRRRAEIILPDINDVMKATTQWAWNWLEIGIPYRRFLSHSSRLHCCRYCWWRWALLNSWYLPPWLTIPYHWRSHCSTPNRWSTYSLRRWYNSPPLLVTQALFTSGESSHRYLEGTVSTSPLPFPPGRLRPPLPTWRVIAIVVGGRWVGGLTLLPWRLLLVQWRHWENTGPPPADVTYLRDAEEGGWWWNANP